MNPSEMELDKRIVFYCESCHGSKDDVFILRDGSVVCGDCVDLWEATERDRTEPLWQATTQKLQTT